MRGKFQKEYSLKKDKLYKVDIVTVGDIVDFDLNRDGSGVITDFHPRKNYISRKAPRIKGAGVRGERLEQVIAANIDNLVIVSTCSHPKFNNRLIDRLIVAAESSHVDPVIIINKIDLDKEKDYLKWIELYKNIGYKIFATSVKEKSGIDDLLQEIKNKTNLIWGQSGVGKSSIINSMFPTLKLKTGDISKYTSKGIHTTVTSVLNKVDDTFIIDTPGIREIDPYGIKKEDVGHYFKEISDLLNECRFNTCTHHHEPGCAVIDAYEKGIISPDRYQSYLNILDSVEEDLFF